MDRDELHARVRRLIFSSPALSEAFSKGEFRSVFKGRGMDFEALRDYQHGDDARLIDWNATVRLARPYVRLYREDRSLTLFLLLDLSASMESGSGEMSKADMAILATSLLGYAAGIRGMAVGALLFKPGESRYFQPRRGKAQALAISEAALDFAGPGSGRGEGSGRAFAQALDSAGRLLKRRSLVVLASDFLARGYAGELGRLAHRHDLVALRITDALDTALPAFGSFHLRDAESGERRLFPLGSRALREAWADRGRDEADAAREACLAARAAYLDLDTADDPALALLSFFGSRRQG